MRAVSPCRSARRPRWTPRSTAQRGRSSTSPHARTTGSPPSRPSRRPACRSSPWGSTTTWRCGGRRGTRARRRSMRIASCSSAATASSRHGSRRCRPLRPRRRDDDPGLVVGPMTITRPGVPGIPASRYAERLQAARVQAARAGLDALLVGVGADLRYLTGYEAKPLERLTMLVLPAMDGAPPTLIAPRLEVTPARSCAAARAGAVEIATWEETDDPMALVATRLATATRGKADEVAAVAVSDGLRAAFVLGLQAVLPGARFSLTSSVLRTLRMRKDAEEIAALRAAGAAADRVVMAIAGGRLVGRTEADVAREVRERLIAEGHETAEFSIVASGPNSASPHHDPGERAIAGGEPIVLDIGGTVHGYASDTTRTLWVTGPGGAGPDAEFQRLYDVLQGAQAVAIAAVRPGVTCEAIDAAARDVIAESGYGPRFFHRTGHGIGLEGHEDPYIVAGNGERMEVGYAFSVEPGIYLEGRFGARIEDIVVCDEAGPVALNEATRDLLVVDG